MPCFGTRSGHTSHAGAAIAANALVFASAIVPLVAQQAPLDTPASRPEPAACPRATSAPGPFSLEQMLSYAYIEELVTSPTQPRLAWVTVRAGVRNVWAAAGPDYAAHQLTDYRADDGQELTNLSISGDGKFVVFVRGGDHDANWDARRRRTAKPEPFAHAAQSPSLGGGARQWRRALRAEAARRRRSARAFAARRSRRLPQGQSAQHRPHRRIGPGKIPGVRARHEQLTRVVTQR